MAMYYELHYVIAILFISSKRFINYLLCVHKFGIRVIYAKDKLKK